MIVPSKERTHSLLYAQTSKERTHSLLYAQTSTDTYNILGGGGAHNITTYENVRYMSSEMHNNYEDQHAYDADNNLTVDNMRGPEGTGDQQMEEQAMNSEEEREAERIAEEEKRLAAEARRIQEEKDIMEMVK